MALPDHNFLIHLPCLAVLSFVRCSYFSPLGRLHCRKNSRILLLIILASCDSAGSFVVNVTQSSYQAEENHNVTLEWKFTTNPYNSTKLLLIFCEMINDHEVSVLYHVRDGVEVSESQHEKFSGRVQSDQDALREGRIRLQLCRLRPDDSGLYLCDVNTDYGIGSARCRLIITGDDDQQETQRPTLTPEMEIWTVIGYYIGLMQ